MADPVDRLTRSLQSSQMLRLASVAFLALVLQIPISMIGRLVAERQHRHQGVVEEVSSKWGRVQALTGPALVVPYRHRFAESSVGGGRVEGSEIRHLIALPERLDVRGSIDTEVRQRGIFSVPVYTLGLRVEGEFARPNPWALSVDPAAVSWERAQLAIGISDTRAIQQETAVHWNGARAPFLPGTGAFTDAGPGMHAGVDLSGDAERFQFSFPLSLNGSVGAYLTPFGRNTTVAIDSDYAHPSFQGNWLPAERSVSDSGFEASWSIPFLGRNYPQTWRAENSLLDAIERSRFGVELASPVDHYRMAERSVKYAGLFILLTFATIWLIEVLAGVRVHPIQYLLLGGALCLFYLLELSLSEHLGFPAAYALASTAVIAMVAAYSASVLKRPLRALVVGAGVALLYAYLYVLLTNEDYALVVGSVGLFAVLAAIMYATRRVDWYTVGVASAADTSS